MSAYHVLATNAEHIMFLVWTVTTTPLERGVYATDGRIATDDGPIPHVQVIHSSSNASLPVCEVFREDLLDMRRGGYRCSKTAFRSMEPYQIAVSEQDRLSSSSLISLVG